MIERFQVLRNGKVWGYAPTEAEALEVIKRNHKPKQKVDWDVVDLRGDVEVSATAEVSKIERKARDAKRKKPSKPKVKKNDVVDDAYSAWLGRQKCVVTGQTAPRGAGAHNMHCHHIHGRGRGRNDHLQVPLMGFAHSWGGKSYHSAGRAEFRAHYGLICEDVVAYFVECAADFRKRYLEETGDG